MSTAPPPVARRTVRPLAVVAAVFAAFAGVPVLATPAESQESGQAVVRVETRDPLSWPFSRDSIWNTPIGSGAKYVPAGLEAANGAWHNSVTADPELISLDPEDPVRTLKSPGQPGHGAKVRVAPDLAHDGSWNGCSTLLAADGRSVWSGQPLRLSEGGHPAWRWTPHKAAMDLRGPGAEGCHGGSRLSGLGGSLRVGELDSPDPLRHVLKVNLNCKEYCYRGGSRSASKRWPAQTADAYWRTGYGGRLPALRMGALLALPPGTDLSAITHPKARKMAMAFRDYGAYLVDDTTWDAHTVNMDKRVLDSGEWPGSSDLAFHAQLQKVFQLLAVVDNNTAASVGGGGTPRAPLAPCFHDDEECQQEGAPDSPSYPRTGGDATDTHLSALEPAKAENGRGLVEEDRSNGGAGARDGRPLTIGGRTFGTGLGVHARSDITYQLDGKYAHFTTMVGIDDEVGAKGSAVFKVYVDGALEQRTSRRTGRDGPLRVSQSVSGAQTLRLVVTDAGDGRDSDHADWADARLWVAK